MQTLHGRGKNSHVALFPQAYPNVHWWPLDDVTFAASFLHLENISWAIQADIAILNQGMTVTHTRRQGIMVSNNSCSGWGDMRRSNRRVFNNSTGGEDLLYIVFFGLLG